LQNGAEKSKTNSMKSSLSFAAILFTICFFRADIYAQQLFKTDSLSIASDKTTSFAVKGTNGVMLLIKGDSKLHILFYDTSFRMKLHMDKDVNEKLGTNELIGAVQTGNTLTILLSDTKQKNFTTILVDVYSHQFLPAYDFILDKSGYLNYFERNGKLNVLTIKNESSLFSIITFDSTGRRAVMDFDLSEEKFNGDKAVDFSYLLEDENQSMYTHRHRLDKINTGEYISDITSRYFAKMYTAGDELFITINWRTGLHRTQVIRLDLKYGHHKYYNIPYPGSPEDEYKISQVCSFLLGHKLYTAFTNDKNLEVGIYDLDSCQYIRHWGPDQRSLDSIISSPFIDENLKKGKTDTIKTLRKFLGKSFDLSISANQNGNGDIDIFIGEALDNSGGGGGGMMMGAPMGGMGAAMAPMMFYMPGIPFSKKGKPEVEKHRFFWCTIDSTSHLKSSPSARLSAFRQYEEKYYDLISLDSDDDITTLNYGSVFYLGSYYPAQSIYLFRRYK